MVASVQPAVPVADRVAHVRASLQQQFSDSNVIPFPGTLQQPTWTQAALAGRLCELSSETGAGQLTAAFQLVLDAQASGEPVAWISSTEDLFYAPDVAEMGIDLQALPVLCLNDAQAAGRAADKLLRSGAYGLLVLDLGNCGILPVPLQNRLVQLARTHQTAVLCLTRKQKKEASLSPVVSLRAHTSVQRLDEQRFEYTVQVTKDKHQGPDWSFQEIGYGPTGLH